jgi:phage terminase Nu1 subunit (DNA packaging protein)
MKKKSQPQPEQAAPDLSRKIREAEVKNIIAKLKAGKTLTARESKIASEFADEKDGRKKITQEELAALWGMSQPNIHKLVKQGMPMDSVESATAWRKQFLEDRAPPASYQEARTKKALLECEKLEMQLAVLKGDYEPKAQVREDGIRIGAIFTAKLAALVNDASGALAGLDEVTLRKKLHERTQQILSEIKDEISKGKN